MKIAAPSLPAFRRLMRPVGKGDALAWLQAQPVAAPRLFWSSRDGELTLAGAGAAHVVSGDAAGGVTPVIRAMTDILARSDAGIRFVGGMRFDTSRPADSVWSAFPAYWFAVPAIEWVQQGGVPHLAVNVPADLDDDAARALLARAEARLAGTARLGSGLLATRADAPDRHTWMRLLERTLLAIDAGEIAKVVLARCTRLAFADRVDSFALLRRLRDSTRDCFHFAIQPTPEAVFIGASPERLFRRQGRGLEAEAVAGTCPRGATQEADRQLGAALLGSDKERREHLLVRDMIHQVLRDLCTDLRVDAQPSLLQLTRGQHLFSGLSGTLRNGINDTELLEALHPTPAVAGSPTPSALARIRAWEPFDRGWYAAPVGWIARDAAEFAVAIRSALCHERELALFSGAGIVPGSVPAEEWDEIEHKIQDFLSVLQASA